jgi:thioredoxin reductase (NADPH)
MPEQTLQSIAFPTLSDAQIREFEAGTGAVSRSVPDGRTLIAVGDRDFKFFIVKAGQIEILDHSGDTPKTVVVHGKGQFTGDVSHLTGRASVISAIARGDCVVAEVSGDALRGALNQCPTLSDILLQAFIARRQLLRESGNFVGLRVIGSRYSTDIFRVRDFLAKNRALFTWLDVETHPEVGQLLQHFGLTEADTPVVALGTCCSCGTPRTGSWPTRSASISRWSRRSTIWSWWAPDRRAWRPPSTAPPKACARYWSSARRQEDRRAPACGSRTISVFPPG